MTAKQYKLYGTVGCHLCELAIEHCELVLATSEFEYVDIVDDDELVELYSTSIPVLENIATGEKLFWPFAHNDIRNIQ